MPDYRLFALDELGHIHEPAQVLTCDDDEDALATAGKMVDGHR